MATQSARHRKEIQKEKVDWVRKVFGMIVQLDQLAAIPEFGSKTWKLEFFRVINDIDSSLCTHYPTTIFNHNLGDDHLRSIVQAYKNMCASIDEARIFVAGKNVGELQRVCFNLKINGETLQELIEEEENKQKRAA